MNVIKKYIKKHKVEFILVIASLIFSYWLMFSTFSYQNGSLEISTKAWSDFASHIPLIRSFSFGENFPPEYPLFSGSPIRYHFLFYALAGFLEKVGLRLDYALNIPSILGFTFLLFMIYIFSKEVFKSKAIGILSVILFLFNGSLSFIKYFSTLSLSKESVINFVNINQFVSFGPYDGSIISAFWNLNIYTNQRHLALSYGVALLIIYFFVKSGLLINIKKSILIGIILGVSFILNMAVFATSLLVLTTMFLLFNKNRFYLFITLLTGVILAVPQYIWMQPLNSSFKPLIHLGYLVENLNLNSFINYWFQNIGFHFLIIPLAFIFVSKTQRKVLASFFTLFVIGNLIQFSPEIAANHKFFNLFMIIGVMYSSFMLVYLWNKKMFLKIVTVILFMFLIFSGVLDFFPILNDKKIGLSDFPNNKNIYWVMKNTNPNSTFLNTNYLYDDVSLAGRKIFLGWPYFAWSQGYDTLSRDNLRKSLLNTNDKTYFCKYIIENKIDYVELNENNNEINVNKNFFDVNFPKVYDNKSSFLTIYKIEDKCL
jgi:hypothetical protein